MKKKRTVLRTIVLITLIGALVYTLYSNFFSDQDAIKIGEEAPNFMLNDLDGKEVELEQYRGKGVFLNFWATWCKPCEIEMPYIEEQYQIYKDQGVEVLAVNVGDAELSVRQFIERKGLTFPVVIDENSEVVNAYHVGPLPTSFVIDPDGKIVDVLIGSLTEEKIANYMEKMKP